MDVTAGVEATRFIGERVPRREDARLLTGRGRYVDDVVLPGMLHAAFVRSPHASAAITAIDTDAAAALDGVRAVLTFDDLAAVGTVDGTVPRRPLAHGSVCFVGDPVVIVVAESRARAEDACELVHVHYDATAALVEPRAAIADTEHRVHQELESNIVAIGASADDPELDDLFATAAHVVTETISQHRYLAVPMETRGIVASWDPVQQRDDDLDLHPGRAHGARSLRGRARVSTPRACT